MLLCMSSLPKYVSGILDQRKTERRFRQIGRWVSRPFAGALAMCPADAALCAAMMQMQHLFFFRFAQR